MVVKEPDVFRFSFVNINGLPNQVNHEKHDLINQSMTKLNIDVLGMAEINLNPHKLPARAQWKDRFRSMRTNSHFAYNKHASKHLRDLYGGTAYLTSPAASHRVEEKGEDPSGLGRWVWTRIIGKGGITTRIIIGYRPVEDTSDRAGSVYSQHQQRFAQQRVQRDPRKAFLDDMEMEVNKWLAAGEQIVIGMDLNDDSWDSAAATKLESWGLINTLKETHPQLPKVATCDKNRTHRPIDGIWTTPGLTATSAGMLGFGSPDLGSCDHRVIWADFRHETIYGYKPPALEQPLHIGIKLNDPGQISKFNRKLKRERKKAKIPQQILELENRAKSKLYDEADDRLYNKLLEKDFEIRKNILVKLRKKYAGNVEYSDVIGKARKEIYMYNLAIKKAANRRMDTRKIRRLMNTLGHTNVLRLPSNALQAARAQSLRRYKEHKKNHKELRQEFARKVYKRRALKYNTTVETQEKIAGNAFKQKGAFGEIRRVLKPVTRESIKYVERTNNEGTNEACWSRQAIENACCDEGYKRYSQAHDTPFLKSPLLEAIGTLGNQDVVEAIIRGVYEPPEEVDEFTKLLIAEMKAPPGILEANTINGYTTTEEHCAGWRKVRSSTASSPFGPTMSEYIAGTHDQEIAEIDAAMASIPSLTGIAPSFWSKGVDVMIPKKNASKRVEKLRIIVLFHALFNQFNKRVARRVMKRAEATGAIPSEIGGGRHRHRSVECGLNKTLSLDGIRQRHVPAILCSNDAKSCYDRIIHSVANICLQRLGVEKETCSVMLGTIQQMQHHVKTAFGISNQHYGCIGIPLQGVLQGNGAGPAIWLVVSITLVNMLKSKGYGLQFINAMNEEDFQFSCYTFVDDTDMIHVGRDDQEFPEVLEDMQSMIDLWAGGLHSTGGKLVVEDKSYWYGIDFVWNKKTCRWDYKRIEHLPGQLTLDLQQGERQALERLDVGEAKETLGMWTTANGDQTTQQHKLRKKVQEWGDKIRTKQLSKSGAWLSLRTGITKSLQYPLTATRLSKKQCDTIDKDLRKIALPALGIPQSFPTALAHAPRAVLGLGIPRLWTQQASDHITCILRHGDGPPTDSTGCLLRDTMANLRMELGLPGHPFQHSFEIFGPMTTRVWLHTSWEFCQDHGLSIQDNQNIFRLKRKDDEYLIMKFAEHGFRAKELSLLNVCRLWLKAITISDLATGDGRALAQQYRTTRHPCSNNNQYTWPKAGEPSKAAWKLWDSAIEKTFLHADDRHCRLRRTLGTWTAPPLHWPYWFSPHTQQLYKHLDTSTWAILESAHATRVANYQYTDERTTTLPPDARPTTVIRCTTRGELRMEGHKAVCATPDVDDQDCYWWGKVRNIPDDIKPILEGIRNGTAVCVTDGSFKNDFGTAAYILLPSIHHKNGITCVNQTPGHAPDIDPYRAELGGIYGCIALVNHLTKLYEIQGGAVTIGCDCKSALFNLFHNEYETPRQPHFDLLHGTRRIMEKSSVTLHHHYVPGHQDDHTNYRTLDRWGQLNVDMDSLAKEYWQVLDHTGWTPRSLPPTTEWSLWRGQRRLTTWKSDDAINLVHERPAQEYWHKKLRVSAPPSNIAWESRKMATTSLPDYRKLWHMKWFTNRVATNGNLKRWSISLTETCPRCGEAEHHRQHVVKCQAQSTTTRWDMAVDNLKTWMQQNQAQPDLAEGLLIGIRSWRNNTTATMPESTWPGVNETLSAQSTIGWGPTLDGMFHSSWVETQESYSKWLNRRTTGKRWVGRLIRQVWEIAWDLWRHRMEALEEPTSETTVATHAILNSAIDDRYAEHAADPHPLLARFFTRDPELLHSESTDFKQHWIEFIDQTLHSLDSFAE